MPNIDDTILRTMPMPAGYETAMAPDTSVVTDKTTDLANKTQSKIQLLASKTNQLTTVADKGKPSTFGEQPSQVNYKTPEELQYELGEAATYQILTRGDGSKYEFRHNPDGSYAHDTQGNWIEDPVNSRRGTENLYIDDTVQGNMKLGIASSGLSQEAIDKGITPFEARYMDKTQYNPYSYEYKQQGTNKLGYDGTPGPMGVTPQDGALMDIELPKGLAEYIEYNTHTNAGQLASRAAGQGKVTQDGKNQFGAGYTEYTNPNAPLWNSNYDMSKAEIDPNTILPKEVRLVGGNVGTPKLTEQDWTEILGDTTIPEYNTLRGVGSASMNVAAKVASLIGEGAESAGQLVGSKDLEMAGTTAQDAATKFQMEEIGNKMTGYNPKEVQELQKELGETIKTEGYLSAFGDAVTDSRSLEALATSIPEMVALAASVGTMAVANANNNINIGENKLGREFTPEEKLISAATSVVSTYLDRAGDKLALGGMNGAKVALKSAINAAPKAVQETLGKMYGSAILKIGEAPLRLAGAAGVEGGTEYLQTLGETAAQQPEVFQNGFSDKTLDEAGVAGVMGAAMGTQMAIPAVAADTLSNSKLDTYLANRDAEAENLAKAKNMEAVGAVTAEAKLHIDKAANIVTGLESDFDTQGKSVGETISDYVTNTKNVFEVAGIQNPEKYAYDLITRRSIQKALDSGNEEMVGRVHNTIKELHDTGKIDASELIADDTQNIMEHFGDVIGTLNRKMDTEAEGVSKKLLAESQDKIADIVAQLNYRKAMYDGINMRGSDEQLPAMKSLEDAIQIATDYQKGKDINAVSKDILDKGFTHINPVTGEIGEDKASINAYKKAAISALTGSKLGEDALRVNTNIANSLIDNVASKTNLGNLDKFAESRISKLNPTKSNPTKFSTESYLSQMMDENNTILEVANAIKQATEASKLVNDKNRVAYAKSIDSVIAKTQAANEELSRRLDAIAETKKNYAGSKTLAYVQRADGTGGVYEGFSIQDDKETGTEIGKGYNGKSTENQIADWQSKIDEIKKAANTDKAGMTPAREKFIEGLTKKIEKSRGVTKVNVLDELKADTKYTEFMAKLEAKYPDRFDAAMKAQDEAYVDGKSADEIKAAVKKVLESYKTKPESKESEVVEGIKTNNELKAELVAKTNEIWAKYETKLAEYREMVDSIEDVNLVAGLKVYKKNVQKELDRSKTMLDKWKAKLGDKTTSKEYVKLVSIVVTKYMNPLFKEVKKLMYKAINKFGLQVKVGVAEVVDVTADIAELQKLTDAYNESVKSSTIEAKTPVGKIVKRLEGVFGAEVEVGGKKTKVVPTEDDMTTKTGVARKDPINTAMNRIIEDQVKTAVAEVVNKGGIEGELLENIMEGNPLSTDKKLFRVTDSGFLGSKEAKDIWDKSAEDVIKSLPEDFTSYFGANEETKAELLSNVEVMQKFIAGVKTVDMQEAMYKAKELFRINPETGVLEATQFPKTYKVSDIEKLKADGKFTGQKVGDVVLDANGEQEFETGPKSGFNALTLLGKKEKVKTKINGKDVITGVKIIMPDRFNDMVKFYAAKVVADIGSLASEIAYEDDSETAKRYGMYGESIDKIKELAKNGQVPLVSVLSEPARAIYKQLGIRGTDLMPEVTEEGIISSIEAVLAMTVMDNGLIEVDDYTMVDDKLVEAAEVIDKDVATGKSYRIASVSKALPVDKRELTASINKLQYISSSRDRKLPMLKAGIDKLDRTMIKSDVPISQLSNKMLNKQEKIPYVLDRVGIDKYMTMSDEDALMALGWQSTDGLHISEVKKRESINDKIEREWDTLKSYCHILGDKTFYLPWGQTISGRDTLVTDLNFQESKLHREFMLAEGKATELDVKALVENPLSNKALIAGVNQGLDLDPDKLSNESTEAVFTGTWKIDDNGVELLEGEESDKIRDMWENMEDPKAIAKVFKETEGYHGVKAVETMKKLDLAIKAGEDKVKVTLGVETDAITSGMILTLIQIGTTNALRFAEKGGLYTKESLGKHTKYVKYWLGSKTKFTPGALIEAGKVHAKAIEAKEAGKAGSKQLKKLEGQPGSLTDEGVFKDLYSTIGIAMVKDVQEYKARLEDSLLDDPKNKKLIRQKMLLDEIGELTLSNVRKIAKSPVMVYIYGAEINSIKQKLVYSLGVDTLVKKIKELRKAIISGDKEKADKLRQFVYSYVKLDEFESITGNRVWPNEMKDGKKVLDAKGKPVQTEEYAKLMAMKEEDKLLHVSLEKAIELLSKDIKDSFGKGIENAFSNNLAFVDANRDRVKSVELMTFEAYKVILKQKIAKRLAEKGIKGGSKSHLSKEDLADIQAEMLDEGFAHVATINPEGDGEKIHQPLKNDSAKQSLEEMATVHRIVDGKPKASNASIRVKKEMAGTGAAPTITIHMQDGTVMRKVLTLEGASWRGDNVYDAIITGLDSMLMEKNAKAYNTEIVETVFDRSILTDNIWKLENMLGYIKKNPDMYVELVANMSLEKSGSNAGLENDKQRLGLGTNRMLDALKDAIELSKQRQVNSAKDFYVAHTFNFGYDNPITKVKGSEVRSKAIASIDNVNALLNDVNAKDMKELGYTILVSTQKGKKLPKKVSANDVIKLKELVTEDKKDFRVRAWLTDAIEIGAKIVNPQEIKDKTLAELVKLKVKEPAKQEVDIIAPNEAFRDNVNKKIECKE